MQDLANVMGRYTVKNPRTGAHRTFRIDLWNPAGVQGQGVWTVGLLQGSDNTEDYRSFARIYPEAKRVRPFRRYNHSEHLAKLAAIAERILFAPDKLPAELEVKPESYCRRCGRALTVPSSIDAGLGPICADKEV